MSEQEKPKRKRRTPEEMEAARASGEVKTKRVRKPKTQGISAISIKSVPAKPPTQGVGVIGINDSAFGSDTSGVRWEVLIHLPKFQAFCIERSGLSYENVMDWIVDFAVGELEKDNCQFFKDYKEWHDAKGYWKNETIYGELIENA